MKWLLTVITLLTLAGCSNDGSKVEDGFLGGIALSTDKTSITSSSNSFMSGTPITLTLTTKDQNGNILISPTPLDIVFSFSGGTSTGTFSPTIDNGNGTYTTTFIGQSSGSATAIVATINGKTITGTSPVVAVTPGNFSLSNSYVTVAASSVNSSSSVTVVLHTKDDANSSLTGGGLVVSFSKSGGNSTGTFSSVTDNADGTYTATFTGVTAGTATSIRAAIGGMNVTSTAPSLTVYAGPAAAIAVSSGDSQSAVVATVLPSNLVAVVTDVNSNLVSSGTVDWTTTGNSVLFGASSSVASGLASNTLTVGTVTGNYTVTAKIHGTTTSTTFTATANPGAINNFLLSGVPTTAVSGTAFNFTVTARDSYNNTKTDYAGVVHFTTTDANSPVLPANYTFVSGDAGVRQFSFTLKTSGNRTVTVNQVAGGTPTVTSNAIAVSAGLASQLIFTSDPVGSSTQAGSAIASISARLLDASGNTATGFNGTVTLAIGTNPGGGTLSGTATGTATSGNISFTGLSIDKAGSGYTLVASSSGVTSATSGAFSITVGPASTISVSSGDSQSAVAGSALTSSLIAVVKDSFGNLVSSGTTVNWITTSGTLGASSSTTSASGLASNTLTTSTTAGSITITATINGTSNSVIFSATGTHGAASQIIYSTAPVGGVAQGVALATQPVLQIKDANNNLVTTGADATANVSLSLTSGTGSLTGNGTVAAVGGIATFSGIAIDTQGAGKIITATKSNTFISGGTTSKTVASSSLTINPPAPGVFTITSAVVSTATSVTLNWAASSNAAAYTIKYGTSSGTYGTTFSTTATSPTTVTGLTAGTTYYFMVTATNVTGSTNAASEISAGLTLTNFSITSATVSGSNKILLAWDPSITAASYTVKYGTTSGTYGTTFSTNATSPLTVTGLTGGTTYYFMVVADNGSGATLNASSEISAKPITAFSLTSVVRVGTSATVSWAAAAGATSYDILFDSTSRAGSGTYAGSSLSMASGSSVTIAASPDIYYFRVRANNSFGTLTSANELFTIDIPFTAATESSYILSDSTRVQFSNGVARLIAADQTDNSTNTGVSSGGFSSGSGTGVAWNNTNKFLYLNTNYNNTSLDATWAPQWASLLGYWKLNEAAGSTTVADSKGSATGTVVGGVTLASAARVGTGAALDGTSGYISLGHTAATRPSLPITMAAWVYLTSTANGMILTTDEFDNFKYCGAHMQVIGAAVSAEIGNCAGGNASNFRAGYTSTTILSLNTWYHVAIVINAYNNMQIYVNGTLTTASGSGAATALGYTASNDGYIGYRGGSGPTYFPGSVDDVALWNVALTAAEIKTIYDRQNIRSTGQVKSRIFDSQATGSTDNTWTWLATKTTLPFYKELPALGASETTTDYSSVGGNLMTGIYGLWHMNQLTLNGTAGEVIDSSGNTTLHHGTRSGVVSTAAGLLGRAAYFSTASDSIQVNSSNLVIPTANSPFSLSAWVYPTAISATTGMAANRIFSIISPTGTGSTVTLGLGSTNKVEYYNAGDGSNPISTTTVALNTWTHVQLNYTGSCFSLYINGKTTGCTSRPVSVGGNYTIKIGSFDGAAYNFNGYIDEAAIWTRSLSSAEVLEVYRRGANRVKYQVRSCSAANCSDQDALTTTGLGWKGPDNTQNTFFTEAYNTTNNVLYSTIKPTSPVFLFSKFTGTGLSVTNNRYVQYRALLESEDSNSLCTYGNCSPELTSSSIGPNHYDSTAQSIITKTTLTTSYANFAVNGFTETLGTNSCASGTRYALSANGTTYYYWNGSAWVTSTDYTTAAAAAPIQANISTFTATAGVGTIQVKTYLKSSGTSDCEVDNIQLNGQN